MNLKRTFETIEIIYNAYFSIFVFFVKIPEKYICSSSAVFLLDDKCDFLVSCMQSFVLTNGMVN